MLLLDAPATPLLCTSPSLTCLLTSSPVLFAAFNLAGAFFVLDFFLLSLCATLTVGNRNEHSALALAEGCAPWDPWVYK